MHRALARWVLQRYIRAAARDLFKEFQAESDLNRGIRDGIAEGVQRMKPHSRTGRAAETLESHYLPRLKELEGEYAAGYEQGFKLLLQEINSYEPPSWLELI